MEAIMNRRQMFKLCGGVGVGLALGGPSPAGHGSKGPGHDGAGPQGPLHAPHAHFCGIHVAKEDPRFQLIVQHYCAAHTGGGQRDAMFQCVLFDSDSANARLLGVEYVITDQSYRQLADGEKKYWHPHTYEVLAGGLVAVGMEAEAERELMKTVLTTWGKAWHTWRDPRTSVPLGEPLLAWSLTADGQVRDGVIAQRDRQFNVSTARIRARRCRELGLEVPQVAPPRSLDAVGRQWTDGGDDRPPSKR
jgi:hypothetical protein